MRAHLLVILAAGGLLLVLGGCRAPEPQSELDRFGAEFDDLPWSVKLDSLRQHSDDPGREGVFATFLLGNSFYNAAVDTAAAGGWNHPTASAYLDSAERHLQRTVALDSTFVPAYVTLGSLMDDRANILSASGDRAAMRTQAEAYYQQAIAIAPDDARARCNLGSLYLQQHRRMDALEQFQHVLDRDPGNALAHYNMAIMFAETKIYREAIREWELAAKYDPDGDIGARSRDNIEIVEQLQRQNESAPATP
jgi:tetratricopeptide (TPR) repeat protein